MNEAVRCVLAALRCQKPVTSEARTTFNFTTERGEEYRGLVAPMRFNTAFGDGPRFSPRSSNSTGRERLSLVSKISRLERSRRSSKPATSTSRPCNTICPSRARRFRRDGTGVRSVPSVRYPPLPAELEATRKPRLLLRFAGEFLFRFADRAFTGPLFQLPPRFTRFVPSDRLQKRR